MVRTLLNGIVQMPSKRMNSGSWVGMVVSVSPEDKHAPLYKGVGRIHIMLVAG